MPLLTSEREIRKLKMSMCRSKLRSIESKVFYLDLGVRRLERQSPESPEEHRRFRLRRMELRHELEMIKIELKIFEERDLKWSETAI